MILTRMKKAYKILFLVCFSLIFIYQAKAQSDSLIAVPQYHVVKQNETLLTISTKYQISLQQLIDWNKLKTDQPIPSQLIIGYVYYKNKQFINTQPNFLDSASIKQKINKMLDISFEERFLLFNAGLKKDSTNRSLIIGGYVDAYYGFYTDSVGNNNFQKFPTIAPRSGTFGINIVQLSARYSSEKVRGIFTLHYGDIPASAWSPTYNFLQEANVGIRIVKDLWIDAGFFRTHLGCESIQPRENINAGVALTTYYDPYFLSGVKLSYKPTENLMLQLNAFNGYNTFVQINNRKTYGATMVYEANENFMCSYNALLSHESPDNQEIKQTRFYQDFFFIYKKPKVDIAFELNFGVQTNSRLKDSTQTAFMFSTSLIGKYKFKKNIGVFGRSEIFQDNDDMLTGPIFNTTHQIVGLNATGTSIGGEIKPTEKSYIRAECRYIQTLNGATIFRYQGMDRTYRTEWLISTGFWF
ncbi:hypothetical protein AD998_14145 [bacterium 336/3]|nr:hypothetical protein AD998_14145 [bacterium 336/3]